MSLPGVALLLVLMGAASATVAAPAYLSIEAMPPAPGAQGSPAQRWTIYLDGQFDGGAAARLAGLIAQQDISQASVYLNSPGGSLIAGMEIGRLLRKHGFQTHVGKRNAGTRSPASGVCYSACPFAYAGGTGRFLAAGSVIGIHRVANRSSVPDEFAFAQVVSGQALAYLTTMGISPELLPMMEKVPPSGIRLLTHAEAVELNLVNDPGPQR